jgi:hypothetical protein
MLIYRICFSKHYIEYSNQEECFVQFNSSNQLHFQLPVQSMPITTNVVSSNPVHGEVYSIQHYVTKFVIDLRHVGGYMLFQTLYRIFQSRGMFCTIQFIQSLEQLDN